jgi:hypothetical protein
VLVELLLAYLEPPLPLEPPPVLEQPLAVRHLLASSILI